MPVDVKCDDLQEPTLVQRVEPNYPAHIRRQGWEGEVELKGIIGTDGKVSDLSVRKSPGKPLSDLAMAAVSQWVYKPAYCKDLEKPVRVYITFTTTFRLESKVSRGVPEMTYVIKAEIRHPRARTFEFPAQKTMYGGKRIAKGDAIFVFASENEGGPGLVARGVVTSAKETPKKRGVARQTPRVSITVRRTALAKRRLGRAELKPFSDWKDGRPETELNFKFYRQATNKIAGHFGGNGRVPPRVLLRDCWRPSAAGCRARGSSARGGRRSGVAADSGTSTRPAR